MKVTMAVYGFNEGKEFRNDLVLPSIPIHEYESQLKEKAASRYIFESMPVTDTIVMKGATIPNFVRIWKWYSPETKEEEKYFKHSS